MTDTKFAYWEVTTGKGVTVEKFVGLEIEDGILKFFDENRDYQALYVLRNIIGAGRITQEEYEAFHARPDVQVSVEDEDHEDGGDDPYRSLIAPYLNQS